MSWCYSVQGRGRKCRACRCGLSADLLASCWLDSYWLGLRGGFASYWLGLRGWFGGTGDRVLHT